MVKGLYFVYGNINFSKPTGIDKKILAQLNCFQMKGIDIRPEILKRRRGSFWNYDKSYSNVNFIYFRKCTTIDWRFYNFFKCLKRDNPNIVVFMEIPTFPYDEEGFHTIYGKITLLIDHFFRLKISKFIDRIILVAGHTEKELWGIRTICMKNGIQVSDITPRVVNSESDAINISCIARFSAWHGYERLIKGIYKYYTSGGKRNIQVHMVGDGIELENYKNLTERLNLKNHVIFYGALYDEELNDIYNQTDIGCCSLGRYKTNINVVSDLKSREFLAKGIPLICGCIVDALDEIDFKYAIYFSNDNSEIDIKRVIDFYDGLLVDESKEEITGSIRKLAFDLVDVKNTFSRVLEESTNILKKE
ncbi:MAG: glycosyltransferase [Lachnospiraceae bacterium]|nr:glycosyltransferase [Lachnospiraceae bacterium]